MSDKCKPSAVLFKAAREMEKRGRATGQMVDSSTGAVCAVGAIRIAAGSEPQYDNNCSTETRLLLRGYLREQGIQDPNRRYSADEVYFNDIVAKSKTAVVKKLREAARYIKSLGQ